MFGSPPQQEEKSWALVLIGTGIFMLLKGPGRFAVWAIPGAENAPSFEKSNTELMMAGGVMLIAGAAMAWHAWTRPNEVTRRDYTPMEEKSGAIVMIVVGLFVLFNPAFHTAGRALMIAAGLLVIAGAAMAWHAWTRPN